MVGWFLVIVIELTEGEDKPAKELVYTEEVSVEDGEHQLSGVPLGWDGPAHHTSHNSPKHIWTKKLPSMKNKEYQ